MMFIIMTACVDPLDVEVDDYNSKLVVFGEVSTLEEPYKIVLTRTTDYSRSNNPAEENARVSVISSEGTEYSFYEKAPGIYESCPSEFVAKIGNEYKLAITTSSDEVYESGFEPIIPSGEIDSIYYQYKENPHSEGNPGSIVRGVEVYCDFQDRLDKDYFKLDWAGTYQFRSGAFDQERDYCWNTEFPSFNLNAFDDEYANNQLVKGERVCFLEDGLRFSIKYNIQVRLKSLTPGGYEFWQSVQDQYANDGSIFAPTPSPIESNISCISHPEKDALGYFFTSDVATRRLYIPASAILGDNEAILDCEVFEVGDDVAAYCYDCREYSSNSKSEPPEYWNWK